MGRVSGTTCERWQGHLAMAAIGRLEAEEERELGDHLVQCAQCRRDAAELADVAASLARVEDHAIDGLGRIGAAPGVEIPDRIVPERARRPARAKVREVLVGVGAVIAVATTAAAVAATLGGAPGPVAREVAFSGGVGVHASASLTAAPWGTRILLEESGQPSGQIFTVSMRTGSGRWWTAGSYRTSVRSGTLKVELSCPAQPSRITEVWITDRAGRTVLDGWVA